MDDFCFPQLHLAEPMSDDFRQVKQNADTKHDTFVSSAVTRHSKCIKSLLMMMIEDIEKDINNSLK